MAPISTEHPLSKTFHFVAGITIPECEVLESACSFDTLYVSLGVGIMLSVLHGDGAFDVMTIMLGIPVSVSARKDLRIEISDYLIARIGEPWLHDLMVACQELEKADVILYRSGEVVVIDAPTAPAPAFADLAVETAEHQVVLAPDAETFSAMRWASKLNDDACVLSLMHSLPKELVEEQVTLYRR